MSLSQLFKKPSGILGIDMDQHAIRLVELTRNKQNYALKSCAYILLPSTSDQLNNSLYRHCEHYAGASVAIAINDLNVLCKTIDLDATLSQQEIATHIRQHAQQHFNLQPEELLLDFTVLDATNKQSGLMQIKWVAARRRDLENNMQLFKQAGLATKIIDIDSHVIARTVAHANSDHANIAIIYLNKTVVMLMLLNNHQLTYSKSDSFRLSGGYQASPDHGLAPIILRMLQLSPATTRQPPISLLLLAGDLISAALAENLQQQIGITTQLADPFAQIDTNAWSHIIEQIPRHEWLLSVGLAMRDLP